MDIDPPASTSSGSVKGDKKRFEVKKVTFSVSYAAYKATY